MPKNRKTGECLCRKCGVVLEIGINCDVDCCRPLRYVCFECIETQKEKVKALSRRRRAVLRGTTSEKIKENRETIARTRAEVRESRALRQDLISTVNFGSVNEGFFEIFCLKHLLRIFKQVGHQPFDYSLYLPDDGSGDHKSFRVEVKAAQETPSGSLIVHYGKTITSTLDLGTVRRNYEDDFDILAVVYEGKLFLLTSEQLTGEKATTLNAQMQIDFAAETVVEQWKKDAAALEAKAKDVP